MRILSLGAGVQSTTLLLMSASGELEHLDAAIFADTGAEPQAVYDHLDRLEAEVAKPARIPIYRVSYGNLGDDLLDPNRMAMIPAYTLGPEQTVTVVDDWQPCRENCGWAAWHLRWDLELLDVDDYDSDVPKVFARAEEEKPPHCTGCDDQGRTPYRSHTEVRRPGAGRAADHARGPAQPQRHGRAARPSGGGPVIALMILVISIGEAGIHYALHHRTGLAGAVLALGGWIAHRARRRFRHTGKRVVGMPPLAPRVTPEPELEGVAA